MNHLLRLMKVLLLSLMLFSTATASQTVDINKADAKTLAQGLHGIGMSKAEAIIAYREQHGPFTRTEQLTEVKGIGPVTLEKNRDRILLKSSNTPKPDLGEIHD